MAWALSTTPTKQCAFTALAALLFVVHQARLSSAYVFAPEDRWSVTASGATGVIGTPTTLTWSFAPDGTSIPDKTASNLISYFDGLFHVASGGSDLTQRPWFTYFQQSFDRWSALGGITFNYEPNDNGSSLRDSSGVLGVRGDVRIGGTFDDGANGTLAYTWLPDVGDMVIDTGETNFYSNGANNHRQLRNTIMHELGHAFGLSHVQSSTDVLLMEPYIDTSIDGPQLDDVRGIQGLYGDVFEKSNGGLGNGTAARATSLGSLALGSTLAVGSDAIGGQSVSPTETDFVSITNSSDIDFYSFSVASPTLLTATLTPLGGIFNQGVEGDEQSSFNANARNDLTLSIFTANSTIPLDTANFTGAGGVESLTGVSLASAGQYFARVAGADDNVQLYQLQLAAAAFATVLAGDYNNNGVVDAADYSVWRDSFGMVGANLPADGNGNGTVDAADYSLWTSHFGMSSGAGSGSLAGGSSVPEPAGLMLLAITALLSPLVRARRVGCIARRSVTEIDLQE